MLTFVRQCLLAAIILAWPMTAQANVGEDLSQVAARYGKCKIIAGQMVFERGNFSITVYVDGDHSAMEIFTRNSTDPDKSELSQKDIDQILDAESDGKAWNPVQVHSGKPTWIRADNKLIARLNPNTTGKPDDAAVLVIMLNTK